ncbi:MAG: phosphate acetyltransferase [Legionellales bacterium]|nr:phosphate acetyltransferase [Legionellales bacterium]
MLVPTGVGVGLTTVALGLERAFDSQGIKTVFFKPIAQDRHIKQQTKTTLETLTDSEKAIQLKQVELSNAEKLLSEGKKDQLLEDIIANFETVARDAEVVIVQGLISTKDYPYAARLNYEIYKALDAEVIFVASPGKLSPDSFSEQLEINARYYGGIDNPNLLGCIVNKINAPIDAKGFVSLHLDAQQPFETTDKTALYDEVKQWRIFAKSQFRLLGAISWNKLLVAPRVSDIASALNADILNAGNMQQRRVQNITLCARSLQNMLSALTEDTLVVTAGDRVDIIIAACMAAASGIRLAGLLLTGEYVLDSSTQTLCSKALETGLPIISVATDSYRTVLSIEQLGNEVPDDDFERIEKVKDNAARFIDKNWIKSITKNQHERRLSPPAFRYQLIETARNANKLIILPEGEEPRVIKAAQICAERNIARTLLLGQPERIHALAKTAGFNLHPSIMIKDPHELRAQYVAPLVKLRENKGMTTHRAKEYLEDNIVLATMLLQQNEVDGLVAGSITTTANTIRPALQLIKVSEGFSLVSSIFFMCLPEQVLIYGDCAVNPTPSAEQLADIAIQSANSATAFGIVPRIAMISYSTGASGIGADVEKVTKATQLVQERRPDLIVDGPLQYDAAQNPQVAKTKAPNSPVAGKANVFIFPDLNTGNTTYKAVQRSADVLSIGPMLQGLRKPVNDLSRGALVDDIVFTIAITAIQAAFSHI